MYLTLEAIKAVFGRMHTCIKARLGNRATLGSLRKFIEYCRIVEILPVIPLGITGSSSTILQYSMNLHKGPKRPYCLAYPRL